MRKVLLSCASAILLLSACKKDDNGSGGTSRTSTLTTGKWLLTAQTSQTITNGTAGATDDTYADLDACEKDDYTIFSTSNNFIVIDEGTNKCGSLQQYNVGIWTLMGGDTKLRQSNAVVTVDWNIDQLDGSTMKLTNYDTSGNVVYKNSSTYQHVQ